MRSSCLLAGFIYSGWWWDSSITECWDLQRCFLNVWEILGAASCQHMPSGPSLTMLRSSTTGWWDSQCESSAIDRLWHPSEQHIPSFKKSLALTGPEGWLLTMQQTLSTEFPFRSRGLATVRLLIIPTSHQYYILEGWGFLSGFVCTLRSHFKFYIYRKILLILYTLPLSRFPLASTRN